MILSISLSALIPMFYAGGAASILIGGFFIWKFRKHPKKVNRKFYETGILQEENYEYR